ncbi:hypothetical protein [Bosea sp. BH3]|uniref:hypothetical protein n=1 Tax=Bosea sp. BH3 TaxID=2871701 RepID=UPI0021CAE5DE|nr:hypothetical protein [Bosea sp. BH3]MCU4181152.1 hypothetical protein [Bosea sp. BH3]
MSKTSVEQGSLAARLRAAAQAILRYGMAAIGPIAVAGSQFLLSLQLLRYLSPDDFGAFSFLLIASQFLTGISNALLCAPLSVVASNSNASERDALLRSVFAVNACLTAATLALFGLAGGALGSTALGTALFAVYAALAMMRWFARADAYAAGMPWRTIASDLAYSATLLIGIALLTILGSRTVDPPYAVLLASSAVGMLPFGRRYFSNQMRAFGRAQLRAYGTIWRRYSSWSLTGVVTTEMTGNAHAYIVTLLSGSTAFATVAASALLIRPMTVVMNALTEFERPRMARELDAGRLPAVLRSLVSFRLVLIAGWIVSGLAAAAVLLLNPGLLFPGSYDLNALMTGCALWIVIAGIRLMRTPESAVLQAAGMFRPLAYASIISCGVSVAAVAGILLLAGPIWSIAGILLGEAVFAGWIWRQALRWRRNALAARD